MNRALLQTCLTRITLSKAVKKSYLPLTNTIFVRDNATDSARTVLFPVKDEFPDRHIGPKDHDVIIMLDLLGYKVRKYIFCPFFKFYLFDCSY